VHRFDDLTGNFVAEAMRAGLISTSEANTARGRISRLMISFLYTTVMSADYFLMSYR